jgi:radical SAM protein with 4Fe4S-binding SPASM domain
MDNDRFSLNSFFRRTYLRLYPRYIEQQKCPLKCQALASSFYLDPYGNLFPCTIYNKKLLNIRQMNGDFLNAWNSKDAKNLYYECSNHVCPGCWSPCDAYVAIVGSLLKALFMKIW